MSDGQDKIELAISGMNCSHCSSSVERGLGEITGVTGVQVFLDDGRAVVEGKGLDVSALVSAVVGLGFKAQPKAKVS